MTAHAAPPELHLPDLPEVSVTLGAVAPVRPRVREHWSVRLRNAVSGYLPLLLMALLALGTWWLVKNTPGLPRAPAAAEPRREPDYEMARFAVTRFAKDGRARVHIEGDTLRHLPDVDRLEIDGVHIRAVTPEGRTTLASARRAVANGDATEVQLLGGAKVQSETASAEPVEIESEFLHAQLATEQLRTHLPVTVRQGRSEATAGGLEYDQLRRRLQLKGPVRFVFQPRGAVPATPAR